MNTLFNTDKKSWKKNKENFHFIDLFAGIGGFRIALEKSGGKCVFSSEWDTNSQKTYATNFGDTPHGDITKIDEKMIPKHNVLCAGFPCQAFSISGKMKGFSDTRGTLFFDVARIVKEKQPDVVFLENVKNFARHDNGNTLSVVLTTLEDLGYKVFSSVLRSSDYGVPQARERIYIVAFHKRTKVKYFDFPEKNKKEKVVQDILENNIHPQTKIIIRDDITIDKNKKVIDKRRPLQLGKINNGGQGERIYSVESAGITLSAYGGGVASKTGAYLVGDKIRKLSPRECARLQGFPDDFDIPVSINLAYKQFGDSVSVPVIEQIFKKIIKKYPRLKK
ncbi:MAG TPA: DNA cytosine methyltransferase [Candidatus Paceibacterota bacterium]|nr:DNA cytosine methyltransferase [Candidatus Paceibacterota bacterium]